MTAPTTRGQVPEALRFIKKPVTISAVQYNEAVRDAHLFDGAPLPEGVYIPAKTLHPPTRTVRSADAYIDTLEGRMKVTLGDWIIRGVKGEYYPCKPDIFEATYERAAHVQNPAEIEHVAGDVSKNGAESNTSTQQPAPNAMQSLTAALKGDPEYAWAWHCNLAMPIMDNAKVSHRVANITAARLMQHLFGIDTEKHPHFEVAVEAPQADSQPALPKITAEDRSFLHYNPNTDEAIP